MNSEYIIKNIYPLLWERELERKIDFWREILHDEWNKHLHERAKEEIKSNLEKIAHLNRATHYPPVGEKK